MRVGPHEVEIELVGVGLGEEVSTGRERFQVEELIFDQAMHGFDVALIGVRWQGRELRRGSLCRRPNI